MPSQTREILDPHKSYSDQEMEFLDCLFLPGVQGDVRKAAQKAGYKPTQIPRLTAKLRAEILEVTRSYLALLAPAAAAKLGEVLAEPTKPGHAHALKAVDGVLDRIGMGKQQEHHVTHQHRGVVELPAKEVSRIGPDVVDVTPEGDT